ncbi:hypothetical protein ACX8Z9_09780 [Arthrobacter halodurans]|uniref:DUF4439 domain-containing protein n=1 Tax=Arthrobacter halodurans TaxID=516699 RepID=A0ABV4UNE8_9MICC
MSFLPHASAARRGAGDRPLRRALRRCRRAAGLGIVVAVVAGLCTAAGPQNGAAPGPPGEVANPPSRTAEELLPGLLAAAERMAARPDPGTESEPVGGVAPVGNAGRGRPWPAPELSAVHSVVGRHVDLLTPGGRAAAALALPAVPDPAAAGPLGLAARVAESGNALVSASLATEGTRSRALLGAGLEEALAARRLAAAVGGPRAADALPSPVFAAPGAADPADPDAVWDAAQAAAAVDGACPDAPDKPGSAPVGPPPGVAPDPVPDVGASDPRAAVPDLAAAADAAYRLAYAYQVAGARLGAVRPDEADLAWASARSREVLAHRLERLVPAACGPRRLAAYSLPPDFGVAPVARAAAGEEQLAAALRDAAATAPDALRPVLAAEAWRAALGAVHRGDRFPRLG